MALPNPGMDAVPFTPLTAEFLDDMIENIESLSDGTGFENGAITTNTLAESAVTARKTAFGGDYSTSEVNTGFKWIDGKTIYKKTINFGALPNSTSKSVAHGIAGITYVIGVKGFADNGSMGVPVFIPQVSPVNIVWNISIDVTATDIIIVTRDNYSNRTRTYITIEYVK